MAGQHLDYRAACFFNSLVWDNNWRLWGSSKNLTTIMRKGKPEKSGIDWELTELQTSVYSDYWEIWRKVFSNDEWDRKKYGWMGKRSQIKPLVADCSLCEKEI
jgi:hypothetical protein